MRYHPVSHGKSLKPGSIKSLSFINKKNLQHINQPATFAAILKNQFQKQS